MSPPDFCEISNETWNYGKLWISVYNKGSGTAAASVTEVYFRVPLDEPVDKSCGSGCAEVDVVTPALGPLGSIVMWVAVPEGCFGSSFGIDDTNRCLFKINVDGPNALSESDENNNMAVGACQGLL